MKNYYEIIYLVQDSVDQVYSSECSWSFFSDLDEEAIYSIIEKWNTELEQRNIKGFLALRNGQAPINFDNNTLDVIIKDIYNL